MFPLFRMSLKWMILVLICTCDAAWRGCPQYPEYCRCLANFGQNYTVCDGIGLKTVPTIFPNRLRSLQIVNTSISSFDMDLKGINVLTLSHNPLKHLDLSRGSGDLVILKLRYLNLTEFIAGAHFKNLVRLYLDGNPLKKVDISKMPKPLNFLDLENTGLDCFDGSDKKFEKVHLLNLAGNNLQSLHLTSVALKLDIRGSNISRIKLHSFSSFTTNDALTQDFKADDYSIACDCCFLHVLLEKRFKGITGASCHQARTVGSDVYDLAKAISCDLDQSKGSICAATPPMPPCNNAFTIPPTTPPPSTPPQPPTTKRVTQQTRRSTTSTVKSQQPSTTKAITQVGIVTETETITVTSGGRLI